MINIGKIKVVGFDLDHTLYQKLPEIDRAIQRQLFPLIAKANNCSEERAKKLFDDLYASGKVATATKALEALHVKNAAFHLQSALENVDIGAYLKPDQTVINLLKKIASRFKIDLITGSSKRNTHKKLSALDINPALFGHIITSDTHTKVDGSAFRHWLSQYTHKPEHFLYVGDRASSDHEVPAKLNMQSILVNIDKPNEEHRCLQLPRLHDLADVLGLND